MVRPITEEKRNFILSLYEPSGRNVTRALEILKRKKQRASYTTVWRVWNSARYKSNKEEAKKKATRDSEGVKAILRAYEESGRDIYQAQSRVSSQGYTATAKEIERVVTIVSAYTRYDGNPSLAARSLRHHSEIIAKYWMLAGLKTKKERQTVNRRLEDITQWQ